MSTNNDNIFSFFKITFILTLPVYILCGLGSQNIIFSEDMTVSFIFLSAIAPIGAAIILLSRQKEKGQVKLLLKQTFDFKRIKKKIWYLPIILLIPAIFIMALVILKLLDFIIPTSMLPFAAIPVTFIIFFILAIGEELGWMGYIFKPMQSRYDTFKATLILGMIWAVWHIPFYYFTDLPSTFILIQLGFLILIRFIMVWIFNNSGESVFAMIFFHAVFNVSIAAFPNYQVNPQLGVFITTSCVVVTVLILQLLKRPWRAGISN